MSCCEDPLMIVMRRNLDFEQTAVLLGTDDDLVVVAVVVVAVSNCCVDKGRGCFLPPPGRMKH